MARVFSFHAECPTLRTKVAMPTCTLHHDAGAPPCPCCETPHARTCAPWEGVEAHEYDCCCPLCREAWLLSDSESEEHFGVAMRSSTTGIVSESRTLSNANSADFGGEVSATTLECHFWRQLTETVTD